MIKLLIKGDGDPALLDRACLCLLPHHKTGQFSKKIFDNISFTKVFFATSSTLKPLVSSTSLPHHKTGQFFNIFIKAFLTTTSLSSEFFVSPKHHPRQSLWHLQRYCYQVTNGYEAYQMIAFGELVHWPPWAEVLSRFAIA